MSDSAHPATHEGLSPAVDVTGHGATLQKMRGKQGGFSWKVAAAILWLVFSVALAIWWMIFSLSQVNRLSALPAEMARQHRMLISEGLTLVILLLTGGLTLLYYIGTEIRRAKRIREFFAAFSHDMKTSLASLRLQAESLEEDLKNSGEYRLAKRLVKDTVRLELQLENSLLLAAPERENRLLIESVHLTSMLEMMGHQWPDLEVSIEGDGYVNVDRRALESIFKNLFQNAVVHGRASKMTVDIQSEGPWVTTRLTDDGRGFKGDFRRLGQMFERHSTSSGSGLGLYLAQSLAKRMRGDLRFVDGVSGFTVDVLLPSGLNPVQEEQS
jgi:signal transduction histidine kinase